MTCHPTGEVGLGGWVGCCVMRAPRWPRRRVGWLVALQPPPSPVTPMACVRHAVRGVRGARCTFFRPFFFFSSRPRAPRARHAVGFPTGGLPIEENKVLCWLCHKRTPADRAGERTSRGWQGGGTLPLSLLPSLPLPSLPPPPLPPLPLRLPPPPPPLPLRPPPPRSPPCTSGVGRTRRAQRERLLKCAPRPTVLKLLATSTNPINVDSANDMCRNHDTANEMLMHSTIVMALRLLGQLRDSNSVADLLQLVLAQTPSPSTRPMTEAGCW